jgi:hypothetical protein
MHIFFVQVDPDIDHIAPIVYKLALSDASNVLVICFNPLHNISNDYRLQFLINDLNVRVIHLYQINKLVNLICSPVFWILRKFICNITKRLSARIIKSLIKQRWFKLYLKKLNPISVSVDEAIPNYAKPILSISKEVSASVVVIPTGVCMMPTPKFEFNHNAIYFNYRIVPAMAQISKDFTENMEEMEIHRMGSTRYTKEWQAINIRLLDGVKGKYPLPEANYKLKVVIFGRPQIKFRSDHSLVKRIASESNISFIFKYKPRDKNSGKYDDYPSSLLIRWADVVITSISSIVLDILFYNKIFVYPKYLAPNDFGEFENYDFCCKVRSEDELLNLLKTINKTSDFNKHNKISRERFYNKFVYVNSNRNTLSEFEDFYKRIGSNNL